MASEQITEAESAPIAEDMELEKPQKVPNPAESAPAEEEVPNGDNKSKREREGEEEEEEEKEENGVVSKKQKVEEKSVEEERMEKLDEERESAKENSNPVSLGSKTFDSSVEMFDYFYKFLHQWPTNVKVNKYEYMVLLDLIKKGHPEPNKKIGSGVNAFEIRHHPMWKSRCFFVVRADEIVEDFSFRKCVDHILPLPENMKIKSDVNQALASNGKKGGGGGGGGGRGGHGRGRGRGRGGRFRR